MFKCRMDSLIGETNIHIKSKIKIDNGSRDRFYVNGKGPKRRREWGGRRE